LTTELHYRVFALLLVVGLTLFVHAASAQTKLSDSEMKEIVRLLLEREVPPATDGGTVTVLLGPNVKSSWIPEVPGFTIRQLSYDEASECRCTTISSRHSKAALSKSRSQKAATAARLDGNTNSIARRERGVESCRL